MMQLVIHNTPDLLELLFTSQAKPKEVFAQAEPLFFAEGGLFRRVQAAVKESRGADVFALVRREITGQQGWGLFNPTRQREASAWQFATFREADVLSRLRSTLEQCAQALPGLDLPRTTEVVLVPCDAANRDCTIYNQGLGCFGSAEGLIIIDLWPDAGNLARLPACLARAFIHNVWGHHHPQGLVTLSDWLAVEGLAAAFIERVFSGAAPANWRAPFAAPENWEAELDHIAWTYYGLPSYSQVMVNIYGAVMPIGPERAPQPAALMADELVYSRGVCLAAADVESPILIAAHLYGDEIISAQGHPHAGLGPFAGFEVAAHLISDRLNTGEAFTDLMQAASQQALGL